jgi:phosphatidylglycerophosphate synthase
MPLECIILADGPSALLELSGISIVERLLRTLQRCGITRATVLSGTPKLMEEHMARPSWARAEVEVTVRSRSNELVTIEQIVDVWPKAQQVILVVRGDYVFDSRLLKLLTAQTSAAALVDSANRGELCGASLISRSWAVTQSGSLDDALHLGSKSGLIAVLDVANQPTYHPSLRRNLRPFCFRAPEDPEKKQTERVLLDSVQKGSQDLPAYVHAPIEKFLVSRLCKTSIRPNHISGLWAIAALATTVLFATGHLILGIGLALIIGILDGLDGKLARLKVETTQGGKLEHQVDNFLEIAWPTALAYHFYISGQLPNAFIYLGVIIGADVLDGIGKSGIYSAAEKSLREPVRLDRIVRFFGGRRNIYVWVLIVCVALGAPAKTLIVMAWWESSTAIIDLAHAVWVRLRRRRENRCDQASVLL